MLVKLHEVEPSKSFLVECQRALNHMFPVDERLHRPVQRVLKYPLLFRVTLYLSTYLCYFIESLHKSLPSVL